VFAAINSALRHRRRRIAMLAVMVALAGAVVTAHSVMAGDHMGDGLVMCLAVVEGAVVAVGVAVAVAALALRPQCLIALPVLVEFAHVPTVLGVRARAGPARLQVFRL
jgi:hypothetical protein